MKNSIIKTIAIMLVVAGSAAYADPSASSGQPTTVQKVENGTSRVATETYRGGKRIARETWSGSKSFAGRTWIGVKTVAWAIVDSPMMAYDAIRGEPLPHQQMALTGHGVKKPQSQTTGSNTSQM